jgi:hypothetical protein
MHSENRSPEELVNSKLDEPRGDARHVHSWYSDILAQLDEPSLCELSNDRAGRAYRLLYLPSFDFPIAVRLEIARDGSGEVHVKRHLGFSAVRPGELVEYRRILIEPQSVDCFLREVDIGSFWLLPTEVEACGLDGSHWIIEASDQGRYHSVHRWSPSSGAVRTLGLRLLQMGGVELP